MAKNPRKRRNTSGRDLGWDDFAHRIEDFVHARLENVADQNIDEVRPVLRILLEEFGEAELR